MALSRQRTGLNTLVNEVLRDRLLAEVALPVFVAALMEWLRWEPQLWMVLALYVAFIVSVHVWVKQRLKNKQRLGQDEDMPRVPDEVCKRLKVLFLTANADVGTGQQALHTLLGSQRHIPTDTPAVLPEISQVYGITGAARNPDDQDAEDHAFERQVSDTLVAPKGGVLSRVDKNQVEDLAKVEKALKHVRAEHPGSDVIVDVTGGSKPMSLVAYEAAVRTGLPVTYTVTTDPPPGDRSGLRPFHGMVCLHDPDGRLTAHEEETDA